MISKLQYRQLYQQAQPQYAWNPELYHSVEEWQRAFRPVLRTALGLDRMEADFAGHSPRATQIARDICDGYTRDEWHLEVEPGVQLPFYLLVPDGDAGPRPLVLCPHGHNQPHMYAGISHSDDERNFMEEGDRDVAVQAAREGYIAIAPTTRGFGETRTEEDAAAGALCSCRTQLLHGLLLGRTPIGERVWDTERLIDWAFGHLPVDRSRVAITGNSGGGTTSLYAAACEPRITVAVPSCYFCTFAGSIGSIYHCDCNYVPGLLALGEMWDVAGLIAPRPFCAIAGRDDEIFPVAEVRIAYEKLVEIYSAAGAAENCRLYVGEGGHRYYRAGAWPFIAEQFASA